METNNPGADLIGPAYKAKALYKRREAEVVLTPFTTIGQWFRPGDPVPNRHSDAFTYGIWLYNMDVE